MKFIRSAFPGHASGWLINTRSQARYVFTYLDGKVMFMREYKPPRNIPKMVTSLIQERARAWEL